MLRLLFVANTSVTELDLTESSLYPGEAALPGPDRTRRIYNLVAPLYSISTRLFHSRAHRAALAASKVTNGDNVLEVAMGSGEMFQQLIDVNRQGKTLGVDLSPKMAVRSQTHARRSFPESAAYCQAADVRCLPFPGQAFDLVMSCYIFELLPDDHAESTMAELARVLRPGGRLTLVLVAQNKPAFNALYETCGKLAPAFWGRQVETRIDDLLRHNGFRVQSDRYVGQLFYSSRIISATLPRRTKYGI